MQILILIIYFLLVFFIGYVASRRMHNAFDYLLGGRSFNSYITALGAGASDMSGWLLLGLPGAVYISGLSEIWMPVGLIIGAYLNWLFVAKRLRIFSEITNNALTLPGYVSNRFCDRSGILRLVMAITSLLFFTVYAASGLAAFALLFKVLFGLPYTAGLWFGLLSIFFYTYLGGFIAVNWIDVFQGSLMLFALLIAPVAIWLHLHGAHEITARLSALHIEYTNPLKGVGIISFLSLLGWGFGYCGQPHILVRFMAARSSKSISVAKNVCMVWMILCLIGAVLVGLFGAALYVHAPLAKPETVFLHTAVSLFTPAMAGILLAAVLSAIMSTIAAQLLVCSSALIEDIYLRFLAKKIRVKSEIKLNRIAVVIIALVALLLALDPNNSVLTLVSYAWAGLGAAFGPVILLSLYWRRMSRNGALLGMILGGVTVVLWRSLHVLGGVFELYELIPGFIVSSLGIYFGSIYDMQQNRLHQQVLQQYNKFIGQMKLFDR